MRRAWRTRCNGNDMLKANTLLLTVYMARQAVSTHYAHKRAKGREACTTKNINTSFT